MQKKDWCLVIRTDEVVYGPFASYEECLAAAKQHYATEADYLHADTNADFYACEIVSLKEVK